jgi:hypothetical protein
MELCDKTMDIFIGIFVILMTVLTLPWVFATVDWATRYVDLNTDNHDDW